MVTGCSHDSNWAASTRYMKTTESRKATMKARVALPSSAEVPSVAAR